MSNIGPGFEALLQKIGSGATPWKQAVRVCATSAITLQATQTIDGVALAEGDRVLVTAQANEAENGVYVVAAGTWARAVDMASSSYLKLATQITISEGSLARQIWGLTSPTNGDVRVGVTALTFEQTTASALLASPTGVAQALPDADTTIIAARSRRSVALTANRADTLPDGTTVGERRTVERTLASASGNIFKNRAMNSDGSVAAWLNGPGQVEIAWDGSKWGPVGSDIKERILTPYDFGGRGDGSYDDTAALAAWAAAGSLSSVSCRLHLPEGVWTTTAPVVFTGGVDNFHNLRITGQNGMARASRGSVIRSTGTNRSTPIVRMIGLAGCTIEDIIFDASFISDGVLADIDPTYGSCSGLTFNRCLFLYPREQAGGSAMAVGPVTPTPSTQSDTFAWNDCLFVVQESLSSSVNVDCWKTNQNGNTKNFAFHNCSFYGGRRGINWELASGMLTISGNGSIGGCGVDIYQGGAQLLVLTCESERSGKMLTQVGSFSSADIRGWEWHGGRECADNVAISTTGGRVSVQGSIAINYRGQRTITSVTPGTDVIAFNGDENAVGLTTLNEPIEIRSLGTLPAPLVAGVVYYVRDHNSLGGGLFNCKLSDTPGGGVINITSAGSGTLSFVSPVKITASSLQVGGSASFESRQNHWDCAIDHIPIFEGVNDLLGGTYAGGGGVATNALSENDSGGQTAAPGRLRNVTGLIRESAAHQLWRVTEMGNVVFSGASARYWHVDRFRYTDFSAVASTLQTVYRRLPPRATITAVRVEIVTPFANAAGTTTLNLYEAHTGGTLITACNIEAAAGTVYGETNVELGTAWKNEIGIRPAAATWATPWLINFDFATVGANLSALTNGELLISIEYSVPPRP
ncbi:MAG: hypothetical protein ACRCU1_03485 [Alsobacter sp.]